MNIGALFSSLAPGLKDVGETIERKRKEKEDTEKWQRQQDFQEWLQREMLGLNKRKTKVEEDVAAETIAGGKEERAIKREYLAFDKEKFAKQFGLSERQLETANNQFDRRMLFDEKRAAAADEQFRQTMGLEKDKFDEFKYQFDQNILLSRAELDNRKEEFAKTNGLKVQEFDAYVKNLASNNLINFQTLLNTMENNDKNFAQRIKEFSAIEERENVKISQDAYQNTVAGETADRQLKVAESGAAMSAKKIEAELAAVKTDEIGRAMKLAAQIYEEAPQGEKRKAIDSMYSYLAKAGVKQNSPEWINAMNTFGTEKQNYSVNKQKQSQDIKAGEAQIRNLDASTKRLARPEPISPSIMNMSPFSNPEFIQDETGRSHVVGQELSSLGRLAVSNPDSVPKALEELGRTIATQRAEGLIGPQRPSEQWLEESRRRKESEDFGPIDELRKRKVINKELIELLKIFSPLGLYKD